MKCLLLYAISALLLISCGHAQNKIFYPEHVGDISFDATVDDPNFKICANENNIPQYYNFGKGLQYKGEKFAIDQYFRENYSLKMHEGETGFLTIRFVVNCEGKTGRFRVEEMDDNYDVKKFDESLKNQFLKLTKQMDGWVIGKLQGQKIDYYQYLTFKLHDGQLIEIMP